MADQLFSTSPYGKALFNALGSKKPTIAVLGDSYGEMVAAAIQWACTKFYPADIEFNHTQFDASTNPLGRLFSIGGTSTAQMVSTQVPQFQANPTDVVFIYSGYNDSPNSQATGKSAADNIISAANSCIAAGAKLVVLFGQGAHYGGTTFANITLNSFLSMHARVTPGVMYVDTSALVDPISASNTMPFRGTGNPSYTGPALGGYTHDGIHVSAHAMRTVIAPLIAPILERIARRRVPRSGLNAGWYDSSASPESEMTFDAGGMLGTNGQLNGVANANVSGVTGSAIWNIATAGGLTVTPTLVTGADGYKRQRLTFSGAISGSPGYAICELSTTLSNANGGNAARLFDFEAMVDLVGVTGLMDIVGVQSVSSGPVTTANSSAGASNASHLFPDTTNETGLFLYTMFPKTIAGNNPAFRIIFYFANGKTAAGYADLSRVSCRRAA